MDVDVEGSKAGGRAERSWLYDHIGRLSGIVLGIIVIVFIAVLAATRFEPALDLLVVIVVGVVVIVVGGSMRGGRR